MLEELLNELVDNQNDRFRELKDQEKINKREGNAFIWGTFTNWEPRRMLQIDELCAYL